MAAIKAEEEDNVALALPVLAELKKKYSLPFCIWSGSHNKARYSTVEGIVVLSLSKINKIVLMDGFYAAVMKQCKAELDGSCLAPNQKNWPKPCI